MQPVLLPGVKHLWLIPAEGGARDLVGVDASAALLRCRVLQLLLGCRALRSLLLLMGRLKVAGWHATLHMTQARQQRVTTTCVSIQRASNSGVDMMVRPPAISSLLCWWAG